MVNLTVRVVERDRNGPPVPGVSVLLHGNPFSSPSERQTIPLSETTSEDGAVVFGPIRPGRYDIVVRIPEADAPGLTIESRSSLTLYSGMEKEEVIVVPSLELADISPSAELPNGLVVDDVIFSARLRGSLEVGGRVWEVRGDNLRFRAGGELVNISNNKRVLPYSPAGSTLRLPEGDDYRLSRVEIYIPDRSSRTPGENIIRWTQITNLPLSFRARKGEENVWTIPIHVNAIRQVVGNYPESAPKSFLPFLVRWDLEERLAEEEALDGRIVDIIPIEKDRDVYASLTSNPADAGLTQTPNLPWGTALFLSNRPRGRGAATRCLFQWGAVNLDATTDSRRFVLALYAGEARSGPWPGKIHAHKILEDWVEHEQWDRLINVDEESAGEFEFVPDEGWKLFDVTQLVSDPDTRGVMLRFESEDRPKDGWVEYSFVSSEGERHLPYRRPVLLVIDPEQ
ncbi:carboxypeptidase regulatory-like domain-containing protein [Candidatus Sumerlaeota bacterium]|nr:carboxypeptidase regulatory-like domain-containing protein [Candidatus Sumerlaeota bacterium]